MKRAVKIVGSPMDLGADRRGVDMGPSVLRIAGINQRIAQLGYDVEDIGNVHVHIPETRTVIHSNQKYLHEIAEANRELADKVEGILAADALPVVLGGDHSIAIGTLAGVTRHYRKSNEKIGLIWFDAHGDANTPETSPSGNIHGMPYAAILGYGPPELTELSGSVPIMDSSVCVLIGARELDEGDKQVIIDSGLRVFTMRDLDERGMSSVVDEAIRIASRGTAGFAVTFDMDFIDPDIAPGVGTPVPGGGTYRESHLALEKIADTGRMVSFELTEINPIFDTRNRTAELGVQLTLSALGKKIL
ncbi:MAG TPA: arginase [Blastocatellia bacterium]|nr:arginase [Blastocatellia bacterium]